MSSVGLLFIVLSTADVPAAGEMRENVVFRELGPDVLTAADCRRFGWPDAPRVNPPQESFTVIVPKSYRPDIPADLLVYISPSPRGTMASRRLNVSQLRDLLDDLNCVYIGANHSGNKRDFTSRVQLALMARHNMLASYAIDPQRVVVGGLSGGGRLSTMVGRCAPGLFSGVLAICGCNYHRSVPVSNLGGTVYPVDMVLDARQEALVRDRVSWVLLSGPKDSNYRETLDIGAAYASAGFRTQVMDVPDLGHEIPAPDAIRQALRFLLTPKRERAKPVAASVLPKAGELQQHVVFPTLGPDRVSAAEAARHQWLPAATPNPEEESFTLYVPTTYSPKQPVGIFVYVPPTSDGLMIGKRLTLDDLRALMDDARMIYVAANRSGSDRTVGERLQLVLTARHHVQARYAVEPERVVVAGHSSGARLALVAARHAPDKFPRVLAVGGAGYHKAMKLAGTRTAFSPDMRLTGKEDRIARERLKLAFLSGRRDQAHREVATLSKAYQTAGYRVRLTEFPELEHELPDLQALRATLKWLLDE